MTPQHSAARRGTRPHPHPTMTDSQGRHQAAAGGGAGTFSERSSAVLLGLLVACAAAKMWGVRLPWEVLL